MNTNRHTLRIALNPLSLNFGWNLFFKRVPLCVSMIAALFVTANLHAQEGDKKDAPGEVQIAPIPPEKIPPSPVLYGEDALKSFKIVPGFRVELVAAEPLVHEPVAMTFGPATNQCVTRWENPC